MRLALIIAAPYTDAPGLPPRPQFTAAATRVAEALRQEHADFSLKRLVGDQGLPERLVRALEGQHFEELLIYVAGYLGVDADGAPVVLQGGRPPSALRIEDLRARALECSTRVLLVLDGIVGTAIAGVTAAAASAHVASRVTDLFTAKAAGQSSVFAAVAPWSKESNAELTFTRDWIKMLDILTVARDARTRVTAAWVREGLRARPPQAGVAVQSAICQQDFCILPAEFERGVGPVPPALCAPADTLPGPERASAEGSAVPPASSPRKSPLPPPRRPPPLAAEPPTGKAEPEKHGVPARGEDESARLSESFPEPQAERPHSAPESTARGQLPTAGATRKQESPLAAAQVHLARGEAAVAAALLKAHLDEAPDDAAAFTLAHQALDALGDRDTLDALGRRHFACLPVGAERSQRYGAWIDYWSQTVGDRDRARANVELWLENGFEAAGALSRLILLAEAQGDYGTATRAMERLAAVTRAPEQRADLLANAAERCSSRLLDGERALRLAQAALELNGSHPLATSLLRAHLKDQGRWGELATLIERLPPPSTPDAENEQAMELLALYRDRLHAPHRAAQVLERALARHAAATPALHLEAAELYEDADDIPRAVEHARRALATGAPSATSLHRARALFHRAGELDATWHASTALTLLGEADADERDFAAHFARTTLQTPSRSLSPEDWKRIARSSSTVFDVVLAMVGPAAIAVKEAWRTKRRLSPGALDKEDPAASTTTLARTLVWTSRFLNVPAPMLAVDAHPTQPVTLRLEGDEAIAVVNRALGRGHSLSQLSFLWARELILLRPEYRATAAFPTSDELTQLVVAALALASYASPSELGEEGTFLFKKLKRRFDAPARSQLQTELARAGVSAGYQLLPDAVAGFRRQLALAQNRAALVACGDLAVAAELAGRFPLTGASASEQWYDLVAYANSADFAVLRRDLGVAVDTA